MLVRFVQYTANMNHMALTYTYPQGAGALKIRVNINIYANILLCYFPRRLFGCHKPNLRVRCQRSQAR